MALKLMNALTNKEAVQEIDLLRVIHSIDRIDCFNLT